MPLSCAKHTKTKLEDRQSPCETEHRNFHFDGLQRYILGRISVADRDAVEAVECFCVLSFF